MLVAFTWEILHQYEKTSGGEGRKGCQCQRHRGHEGRVSPERVDVLKVMGQTVLLLLSVETMRGEFQKVFLIGPVRTR